MTVQGRRCVRLRKGAHFHASGSLRRLGSPRQSSQSQKSEDGDLVPRRSPSAGDLEPRPGCCRSARPGGGARFPPPPAPPLSSGPPLLLLPLARKAMCTYLSLSPQKSPASPPDEKQRAWRGQEPGSPGPFPGPSVSPRMGTREPPPGGEMWALSPRLPGSGGAPRPPPRGSFLGKPEREADRRKNSGGEEDTHTAPVHATNTRRARAAVLGSWAPHPGRCPRPRGRADDDARREPRARLTRVCSREGKRAHAAPGAGAPRRQGAQGPQPPTGHGPDGNGMGAPRTRTRGGNGRGRGAGIRGPVRTLRRERPPAGSALV